MGSDGETRSNGLATVASGASLVLAGRVLKLVVRFFILVVLARWLDPTSYGAVVLGVMALSLASLFAGLGLSNGLSRQIPYYEDEPRNARGVLRGSLELGALSTLVVGGGLLLTAPYLADVVFNDPSITPVLQIAALGIPFKIVAGQSLAVAKGSRDAKPHVFVNQIFQPLARSILVTGPVVLDYGAVGAMAGHVTTIVLTAVLALALGYRSINFSPFGPFNSLRYEMLAFSLPLMLSASMQFVIFNTDRFLIGALVDSAGTGVYNIAFQLQNVGMLFFFPIAFLLPPVLTRKDRTGEKGDQKRIYRLTSKWMALLSFPIIAGFVLFPSLAIDLAFGREYAGAATPLQILMIPVLLTVLLGANGKSLVALGYNKTNMYVNGASAGLNIVLNVALIPLFGIIGAAAATAASLVFRDLGFTVLLYYYEGIQPLSAPMLKPLAATTVTMGAVYVLGSTLFAPTLMFGVAYGIVFGVVHVTSVVLTGGIEPEDQEMVELAEEKSGVDLQFAKDKILKLKGASQRIHTR